MHDIDDIDLNLRIIWKKRLSQCFQCHGQPEGECDNFGLESESFVHRSPCHCGLLWASNQTVTILFKHQLKGIVLLGRTVC